MEQHRIEIRVADSYSAADHLGLTGGDNDASQTNIFALEWLPKLRHIVVMKDDALVAHTGVVLRAITVENRSVQVGGIGGVLTRFDCRGQGLGQMGMKAAEDFIRQHQLAQFGMLFCREQMTSWYKRLGWRQVTSPVWIDQPGGTRESPMPVMVKALYQASWPAGTVSLGCFPW